MPEYGLTIGMAIEKQSSNFEVTIPNSHGGTKTSLKIMVAMEVQSTSLKLMECLSIWPHNPIGYNKDIVSAWGCL